LRAQPKSGSSPLHHIGYYPAKPKIVVLCVPCAFAFKNLPQRRKGRKEYTHKIRLAEV